MPPHQRLFVLKRPDQGRDGLKALKVSQGHRHIAEKASALGPEDRAAVETAAELFLAQREQRNQFGHIQTFPRVKSLFVCCARFNVIGADFLADITAEDVIAHQRAQMPWNGPFELDREIRDAAARVEYIRTDKGSRRTCLQAEIALAAPVSDRPVVDQLDI